MMIIARMMMMMMLGGVTFYQTREIIELVLLGTTTWEAAR